MIQNRTNDSLADDSIIDCAKEETMRADYGD